MALLFLFFLSCVISCPLIPRVGCTLPSLCPPSRHDAAALLAFKKAIISDPFHILSAWKLPQTSNCTSSPLVTPPPCHWKGVVCESHRVVALQLNGSQLRGPVSPSLAQLPFLRSLDLSSNNFSSGIPVELGKLRLSLISLKLSKNQLSGSIPPELGMLNKLETLYLSGNELSGAVPASMANCTAIRTLELGSNKLSGRIPTELGLLSRLEILYLFDNELTGEVPASLANCTALRDLALYSNKLLGSIPPELGMLNKLERLYLWENELTGGVPASLANCTALWLLDLGSNQLSGSIPPELGMLNKLEDLFLSENELTGGVPASLANCSALGNLVLENNRLSGNIPTELGMLNKLDGLYVHMNELRGGVPASLANITTLRVLDLNSNNLSGSIPPELGMLNKLENLILWQDELTGGVPASLGNCTVLTYVDLHFNNLSGSIPLELGMLNKLEILYLWQNELTGGVPVSLGNCTALTGLSLSSNHLSGSIPPELGMLNKVEILYLFRNELTGVVPASLANCTAVTDLELYYNKFSGNIPDVFGTMSSLGYLWLSGNFFSGLLPRSLSQLKALYRVELNGNAFTGTIPQFSTPLLNYLLLSNNNLSGSIPESLGTAKGLVEIDLSNNLLSGQVPPNLGSLQDLTVLNLSNNELSGSIPPALGSCAELVILNLSHNKLTGKLPSSFESLQSLIKLDLSDNQLEGLVPNIKPFNDTKLANLRGNPMLCGPIVNRSCNASGQGSLRRETLANMKWIVSLAVAVVLVGLLILGMVIWRHRNLVGCAANIHDSFGQVGDTVERKHLKVSADELREATDGFSEANILGTGGVSTVYRAVLADGTVVAVKVLKAEVVTRVSTDVNVTRLKREVELLGMMRHRNIVRVLGYCFNLDMQAIVLELMPNGNLDTYLHGTQRQEALTKVEKLRLLRGIAQGLEYLHHWHDPGQTIVHCDVKPANILLDEEWEPRMADFGIAKLLPQRDENLQQSASILFRGSIGYIPPEYAFCTQVSSAGDVYSFGVVMLEILTGKRPTEVGSGSDGEQQQTLMSLVQVACPHELLVLFGTPGMTQDEAVGFAQLALSCTSAAPTQRPTMLQVGRALDAITKLSTDTLPHPILLQLSEGLIRATSIMYATVLF